MSAVARIRARRARIRPGRDIVIPGEAASPMDRNPTLVVPAEVIASCLAEARELRRVASRSVIDSVMTQSRRGRSAHAPTG